MKENKYYIPEISEFHVGFEYEQISRLGETWCEMISTTAEDLDAVETEIGMEYVRVPYLTKEDIEAEGWRHEMTFDKEETYKGEYPTQIDFEINDTYKIGGGFLTFTPELHEVKIITVDKGFNRDGPNHSVKFNGIIKNKSEFKRILKMIGV
jgi:hypothetical protein